jgi:HEAT repeat protein
MKDSIEELMIDACADQENVQSILKIIDQNLKSQHSNDRFSALVVFSLIDEPDFDIVSDFFKATLNLAKDENVRVRYQFIEMIALLAESYEKEFIEKYAIECLEIFLSCSKDKVYRIRAHTFSAIRNFYDDFCPKEIATAHSRKLLPDIIQSAKGDNEYVSESALAALIAFAELVPEDVLPYWSQVSQICIKVISSSQTGHNYKGSAIDAATSVGD